MPILSRQQYLHLHWCVGEVLGGWGALEDAVECAGHHAL